jgi:TPR repeat protein
MLRDYSLALRECIDSAEAGDASAQFRLGVMYGLGLGAEQDYTRAVDWYRRAAEAGLPAAQANLGFMYGTGRGVPQDFVQAYAWYSLAAAGGDDLGRRNRDLVAARMSPGQVEAGQSLSATIFDRIG